MSLKKSKFTAVKFRLSWHQRGKAAYPRRSPEIPDIPQMAAGDTTVIPSISSKPRQLTLFLR